MKELKFDVMIGDKFVGTFVYKYCPAFKVKLEDIENFIFKKKPTLKNKMFSVFLYDKDIQIIY